MSKCHSCVHADWRETTLACIACEGFSQWAQRSVPITIQPPVYLDHRDEGYDTLGVCGDGMETVDVVASGYEWECPLCGYINQMDTAPESGDIVYCGVDFARLDSYHITITDWKDNRRHFGYKVLNVDHVRD